MSIIVQQPDSLSFAGNLKKFVVTSAVAVALQLNKGAEQILNETYQPSADNIVEIDLRTVIDKVLSVTLPGTNLITDQASGVADFTATIDGTAVAFRVIKGGVLELGELASAFADDHFLTWQIQDKTILQNQPEWLTIYANAARNLKAKAYYQDKTDASMLITELAASKLLAVDVSWASINALFVKKNPIAWEVWFEDLAGDRLSYVQRYCLRNTVDEEKIFIWANTLGGIDSISLTGSAEDDKKLEHLIAEMGDESLQEYQTDKKREIKQSTGFLTVAESRWIEDFFYSGRRYLVDPDGSVRPIVLASSKVVSSTADDLFDYEFNYRLASESQLLNLDRSFDSLPALEVPVDFFLTELLSGLPVAQYSDGLLMAVQSPFAQAWQKLSMAQLWGSALPGLVDGTTISIVNGKLQANAVSGEVGVSKWGDLTEKPFSTLSNLFSVSPEGVLTLTNTYALIHTHPYLSDSDARIANWNAAFEYRPTWSEVTSKPTWTDKMGWDGAAVTVAGDLHVTGKIVSDGSMQFLGSSSGGTGGDGSTTLWGLSDVADDVQNAVNGDLIMYNGTHFARVNQSALAPAIHTHTIGQVNGLQGVLDGKQALLGYTPYYSANFVAGVNYSAPHSHPYLSDADARIANWTTAFNWGNHAGLYRPIGYVPAWSEVTSKPTWTDKLGWDGAAVTVAGDLHITGKIISDGSMQFYGISSGGSGGGGSTTLWGLSDVADDVQNAVAGDLIMYNGTHFARINQSVLAPAVHYHTIAQVTGLQSALDGKQASGSYILTSDSRLSDSRIASDVYAWAKAATKPSYTKSEVGLPLADNTADSTKSVSYAGNAGLLLGRNDYYHTGNFNRSDVAIVGSSAIFGTNTKIIINDGGFMTIGSPVANDNLVLSAKGGGAVYFNYGNCTGGVKFFNGGTTQVAWIDAAGNAGFSGSITSLGNLSIGTTDPAGYKLRVIGDSAIQGRLSVGQFTNGTAIMDAAGGYAYYGCNTPENGMKINASGNAIFSGKITAVGNGVYSINSSTGFESDGTNLYLKSAGTTYLNNASNAYITSAGAATFGSIVTAPQGNFNETSTYSTAIVMKNRNATQQWGIAIDAMTVDDKYIAFIDQTNSQVALKLQALTGNATFAGSVTAGNASFADTVRIASLNDAAGALVGTTGITFKGGASGWSYVGGAIVGIPVGNYGCDLIFGTKGMGGYEIKERFKIKNDGDSIFTGNVTASGNIIANGTMQFYTGSDRRLKTNFQLIPDALQKIKSLTGYFFDYTDQAMTLGGYTSRRDIGLIAQDVNEILPEACGKLWNTDFMGYKADKLIPLLVEAIKQQQTEIDQLKRQIAA